MVDEAAQDGGDLEVELRLSPAQESGKRRDGAGGGDCLDVGRRLGEVAQEAGSEVEEGAVGGGGGAEDGEGRQVVAVLVHHVDVDFVGDGDVAEGDAGAGLKDGAGGGEPGALFLDEWGGEVVQAGEVVEGGDAGDGVHDDAGGDAQVFQEVIFLFLVQGELEEW